MKRAIRVTVRVVIGCIIILAAWWSYFEWMLPQFRGDQYKSLTDGKVTLTPVQLPDNAATSFMFWQAIGYYDGLRLFKFQYQGKPYVGTIVEMGPTLYFSYIPNN